MEYVFSTIAWNWLIRCHGTVFVKHCSEWFIRRMNMDRNSGANLYIYFTEKSMTFQFFIWLTYMRRFTCLSKENPFKTTIINSLAFAAPNFNTSRRKSGLLLSSIHTSPGQQCWYARMDCVHFCYWCWCLASTPPCRRMAYTFITYQSVLLRMRESIDFS